jgi:tRNA(fMet)-specific endonuclease VapC
MYLLDTDTLTYLYAGQERVVHRLRNVADGNVGTTIINKIEVLRGRIEALRKAADGTQILRAQAHLLRSEALLAELLIVPFDAKATAIFDLLRQTSAIKQIGHADLMIASLALLHSAILVTRNRRHFQNVPRLQIENWVD